MNSIQNNANERGSAILMVLGLLSLLLVMALIFAVTSRNAQIVADANADQTQAKQVSQSALTRATEALFFFQNKGNILQNANLEDSMPYSDYEKSSDLFEQSAVLNSFRDTTDPKIDYFYGERGVSDPSFVGLHPFVGMVDATADWPDLCLYGEFNQEDYASKPFTLQNNTGTDAPYQSIYYTHFDDGYDEGGQESNFVNHDEYEIRKENSLFNIVSKTKLGNAYRAASVSSAIDRDEYYEKSVTDKEADGDPDQFAKLLKTAGASQLQFQEIKGSDNHVTQRLGYVAFADTPKFDLNQIVASEKEDEPKDPNAPNVHVPYVPWVKEDRALNSGDPTDLKSFLQEVDGYDALTSPESAFAIMGYVYTNGKPDKLKKSLVEEETVQYGLHPQELRTREVGGKAVYANNYVLKRGNEGVPPKWFSYDQLLAGAPADATANTQNAYEDVRTAFLKDIYNLSLYSGTEEREYRFNGRFQSLEQMDGFAADEVNEDGTGTVADPRFYLRKVNLAYPSGDYKKPSESADWLSWNGIGDKDAEHWMTTATGLEDLLRIRFGLDYDSGNSERYLFKTNDDTDKTKEVFANMVDACDEDSNVSYGWNADDGSRMTFDIAATTINSATAIQEPEFCGNEMGVPAIMGATVSFGWGINGDAEVKVTSKMEHSVFMHTERGGGGPWGGGGFNTRVRIPVFEFGMVKNGFFSNLDKGAIDFCLKPKVEVNLQNLVNDDLVTNHKKFRVILKGKAVQALKVKKVTMSYDAIGGSGGGGPRPGNGAWVAVVQNGLTGFSMGNGANDKFLAVGTTTKVNAQSLVPSMGMGGNYDRYLTGTDGLGGTSSNYGVTPGAPENAAVLKTLLESAKEFTFDQTIKFDPPSPLANLKALKYQTVELELNPQKLTGFKLPDQNTIQGIYSDSSSGWWGGGRTSYDFYYPTGSVLAVCLDEIVILANEDAGDPASLSDVVYAKASSATSENWNICESSLGEGFQALSSQPVDGLLSELPVEGILCKDPRLNHKNRAWEWLNGNSTVVTGLTGLSRTNYPSLVSYGDVPDNKSATCRKITLPRTDFSDERWCDGEFVKNGCWKLMEDTLKNADPAEAKDWEPDFTPTASTEDHKMGAALSTAVRLNAPFTTLWQLGSIFRGEIGQTLNLKKFGTDATDTITHTYEDGDAWLLDYVNLTTLGYEYGIRGKFNPNCFNKGAYRYLFANIPANEDAEESWIYRPGDCDDSNKKVTRNTYFQDFVDATATNCVDLENKVFSFTNFTNAHDAGSSQSWSPVQAFFRFVNVDGGSGATVQCNDRMAESLIGCTAGLLSTRYETYTVIAVGQSVKWLEDITQALNGMPAGSEARSAFLKQLTNPVQLSDGEWYSILSTQVRLVTLVRDCWFGTFKVARTQLLYP